MIRTLIKKQLFELNSSYFIDRKTGKRRSRGKAAGYITLFVVLILFLAVFFGGMALLLAQNMINSGMDWLFFAIMGLMALAMGVFGSVFNTYAGLYQGKDNDMLLSMPIPPAYILLSRMVGVYAMAMLYSGMVYLPAAIVYWFVARPGAVAIVFSLLLLFLLGYVLYKGIPNISWEFLSTKPSHLTERIGILPDIISTVCMVLTTLVFVLPLGVCAAVYLTEYAANKKVVAVIEYAAETLSGIPSIIYGLVGQMFFCQFLGMKKSLIAGAMTLVIMNLPTIMRTTQESLKTVPQSYREGAFGLGAGKWRVIRTVVLPGCVDGVITGCILAVGRILGETAALLYTAGFAHTLYGSLQETLQSSGATLSVSLYVYAKEQGEFDVAFAIAAILMVLALIIDVAAALVGKYFQRRRSI